MNEDKIDQVLVGQVQSGDKDAFNLLVLKYQSKVSSAIKRIVSDPNVINDVTQETFVKVYRSIETFQGKSTFYTWLYRIAINTAKNYLKYRDRRPPDTDIDYSEAEFFISKDKMGTITTPENLLSRDEIERSLIEGVDTLPDELRTSLILREMGGLTYDEISNIMKCPVGTVRSRIYRARVMLDNFMKPLLD